MSMEYAMSTSEEMVNLLLMEPGHSFHSKPGDMPAYEGAACILQVSLLKDLEIGNLLAFAESDVLLRIERQHALLSGNFLCSKWFYFCIFGNRNMEITACWCFTVSDKASQGLRDDTAGPALSRAVILMAASRGTVHCSDEKET